MTKSKKSKVPSPNISEIRVKLHSKNTMDILLAIRDCAINAITDDAIIASLKHLKQSTLAEWNSAKVSCAACAALHLLGIEQYVGADEQTRNYIETRFFTAK